MAIVRRIFVLVIVSIGGIALLAPLAAQSAAPAAPAVVERLLDLGEAPAPAAAGGPIERGGILSARSATDPLEPADDAEAVDAQPMPTPGSAPMEATLYSKAAPDPPADAPAPVIYSGSGVWDDLAQCESGGNWAINTGNGYYGGLQFSYATWHGYGGGEFAEYPHQATREEQIIVAERLRAARGYAPWPACRDKLGLP